MPFSGPPDQGANRKVVMGVVHLTELEQLKMGSVLDEQAVSISG
ncbi:hypothetical protein NUH87_29010 [Pseudomonas batumici]